MARKPNSQQSQIVTLRVSPQVMMHLKALIKLGLYGKTPPEVAKTLVCRGIEGMIEHGHLKHGEREAA